MRLALRTGLGCTIMLRGRWKPPAGEPGGEAAMTTSSGVADVIVRKRGERVGRAELTWCGGQVPYTAGWERRGLCEDTGGR
jgi:hypothetical protein